jgi:uncharacterized spore protein YtfJ
METLSLLEPLVSEFRKEGSANRIFGEPIITQGKTIIPVAKIAMGVGGGFGHKNGKGNKMAEATANDTRNNGEGGGLGGGLRATAAGVYEVTSKRTRFIPANQTARLIAMATSAFIIGRWFGKRRASKRKAIKNIPS